MLVKVPFFAVLCAFIAATAAAPLPQTADPANLDPAISVQVTDPALDPAIPGQVTDPALDPAPAAVDPANLDPEIDVAVVDDPANLDPEIDVLGVEEDPELKKGIPAPEPPKHEPSPVHEPPKHEPTPVHTPVHEPTHTPIKHISFDKWGGHESLKGFDHFYGIDNFDGHKFEQVFVKKEHELVCRPQEVHIIQQRLLVLQEMAKRIITETICEVETQTIVWEQFRGGLHGFGRDLARFPGHHRVGYDEEIVKHFPKIIKHDGALDLDDWKFTGRDRGKHTVLVKGHNWDDKRSPSRVHKAWNAARRAWFNLYGRRDFD